jgi:hypothetical protein
LKRLWVGLRKRRGEEERLGVGTYVFKFDVQILVDGLEGAADGDGVFKLDGDLLACETFYGGFVSLKF